MINMTRTSMLVTVKLYDGDHVMPSGDAFALVHDIIWEFPPFLHSFYGKIVARNIYFQNHDDNDDDTSASGCSTPPADETHSFQWLPAQQEVEQVALPTTLQVRCRSEAETNFLAFNIKALAMIWERLPNSTKRKQLFLAR